MIDAPGTRPTPSPADSNGPPTLGQHPAHTSTHTDQGGEWEWADQDLNAVPPQRK
ncbi:hypothetical protein AB0H17_23805 [Streptomyces olivoreticuli]